MTSKQQTRRKFLSNMLNLTVANVVVYTAGVVFFNDGQAVAGLKWYSWSSAPPVLGPPCEFDGWTAIVAPNGSLPCPTSGSYCNVFIPPPYSSPPGVTVNYKCQ